MLAKELLYLSLNHASHLISETCGFRLRILGQTPSLNNLAGLLQDKGRYAEAEPLHRRALAIREQALGPGHPDTAVSLNNLGALIHAQGRYAEAEPLARRALAICQAALGHDHPQSVQFRANLTKLLSRRG